VSSSHSRVKNILNNTAGKTSNPDYAGVFPSQKLIGGFYYGGLRPSPLPHSNFSYKNFFLYNPNLTNLLNLLIKKLT
jgi:hypothetical protein